MCIRFESNLISKGIQHTILLITVCIIRFYDAFMASYAEEAAFVGDMGEVYKITKELRNTNTKADTPVPYLNGNILSTDEQKLNSWREHFESVLNHVVSIEVPLLLQLQKLFHQLSIPQTPASKSEFFKSNPYMVAEAL